MIQSMTAFARESAPLNEGVLTVELRTVNHRYLDCTFKLPDALRVMEPRLRDEAGKALARGKLECLVRLQAHQGNTVRRHEKAPALSGCTGIYAAVDSGAALRSLYRSHNVVMKTMTTRGAITRFTADQPIECCTTPDVTAPTEIVPQMKKSLSPCTFAFSSGV